MKTNRNLCGLLAIMNKSLRPRIVQPAMANRVGWQPSYAGFDNLHCSGPYPTNNVPITGYTGSSGAMTIPSTINVTQSPTSS